MRNDAERLADLLAGEPVELFSGDLQFDLPSMAFPIPLALFPIPVILSTVDISLDVEIAGHAAANLFVTSASLISANPLDGVSLANPILNSELIVGLSGTYKFLGGLAGYRVTGDTDFGFEGAGPVSVIPVNFEREAFTIFEEVLPPPPIIHQFSSPQFSHSLNGEGWYLMALSTAGSCFLTQIVTANSMRASRHRHPHHRSV